MVKLEFYKPEDLLELNYQVSEKDLQNTLNVDFALNRTDERRKKGIVTDFPISIFYDEKAVGFFVLDFGEDKFELTENKNSILIRSLSINPIFQGKGMGKNAMVLVQDFIKINFPEVDKLVLTVNETNNLAFQIYLKTGFQFFGKTREGRSGLQKILSKKI